MPSASVAVQLYRSRLYRAVLPTVLRLLVPAHVALYRLLRGRLIDRLAQGFMPVLLLTTTGRRSGQRRTRPVGYVRDGTTFLVVGSNGALHRDPGWLINLRARPVGEIQVRARQTAVRAEILRNVDRDRAWQLVLLRHPFFASYQSAVQRRIEVVRLHPTGEMTGQ